MKKHLTLTIFLLLVLLAVGASASAQSQTSASSDTSAETGTSASPFLRAKYREPVVEPPAEPPSAQGAGSNNNTYVFFRGYLFHITRTNGDPAVINSDAAGSITSVTNFNYGTEGAFKVEAGWNANNNWGFRGSYFYTNQTATESRTGATTAPFFRSPRPLNVLYTGPAANGTPASFRERFRLHVIDLEGTHKWHSSTSSTVVSFGARIAPSRQNYTATDTFATTPEVVTYTQRRTGVGPTGAIDFRHKIGPVWWTGAGRFAVLFGKNNEQATYTGVSPIPPNLSSASRNLSRTNTVWEGETGLEWNTGCCSGGEFFLNGSFIFHEWHNIINVVPTGAVGSSSIQALDNPAAPPTKKGSIRFIGGAFSLGFRF